MEWRTPNVAKDAFLFFVFFFRLKLQLNWLTIVKSVDSFAVLNFIGPEKNPSLATLGVGHKDNIKLLISWLFIYVWAM